MTTANPKNDKRSVLDSGELSLEEAVIDSAFVNGCLKATATMPNGDVFFVNNDGKWERKKMNGWKLS